MTQTEPNQAGSKQTDWVRELMGAWQSAWAGALAAGEGSAKRLLDVLSQMPALGPAREHTEAWRELTAAQSEYQKLEQELRAVLTQVQAEALALVEQRMRERQGADASVGTFRDMYDLWIECGEQVFAKVAHSEAYCKLQAELGNAAMRLRARQQAVIERGLKQLDLPTRSELNTVHKQLRELRAKLAQLEAGAPAEAPHTHTNASGSPLTKRSIFTRTKRKTAASKTTSPAKRNTAISKTPSSVPSPARRGRGRVGARKKSRRS